MALPLRNTINPDAATDDIARHLHGCSVVTNYVGSRVIVANADTGMFPGPATPCEDIGRTRDKETGSMTAHVLIDGVEYRMTLTQVLGR